MWLAVMVSALWFCILGGCPPSCSRLKSDGFRPISGHVFKNPARMEGDGQSYHCQHGWSIMDVFSSGPNAGNLVVTAGLVVLLWSCPLGRRCSIPWAQDRSRLGLIVGGLGHWTWLLILLGFLLSSTKPQVAIRREKSARTERVQRRASWLDQRGGQRCHSGLICIYAYLSDDWTTVVWLFGAAVAVAASDTFASEIGCLDPGTHDHHLQTL